MNRPLTFLGFLGASGLAFGCETSSPAQTTGTGSGGGSGSGSAGGSGGMAVSSSSEAATSGTGGAPAAALVNDGDRFTVTYPAHSGGPVSEYRLYSMRNAADPARIMVASTTSGLSMVDPFVYDGVHVYYRVHAVVSGVEELVLSVDGVQPDRTWSAPITITAPGTYKGNWRSLDPAIAAVTIAKGVTGVIIEGSRIASATDGIRATAGGNEVEVRGSRGWGLHPMKKDSAHGTFLAAYQPVSVIVEHSYAETWLFDVYVNGASTTTAKVVRVRYNRMRNLQGRTTNADGTYQPLRYSTAAHAVQLNHVFGCPGTEIAWNEMSQEPSIGVGEDIVNHYISSGTAASHATIHDNAIYGGFAILPGDTTPGGPGSYAGCGIISDGPETGDLTQHGFLDIYGNIVISTTNAGIGLADGSNVDVHDNRTISAGVLEDGTKIWATNVGIYVDEQGGHISGHYQNNKATSNYSGWLRAPGTQANPGPTAYNNSYDFASDMLEGTHASYMEQQYAPDPTLQAERDEYQLFWTRTRAAMLVVGP